MKTILAFNLIGILYIIFGFLSFLFVAAWVVVEIGQKNVYHAKQYDDLYKKIQAALSWTPTEGSYYSIFKMLSDLQKLKYKDPEMTEVLKNVYYSKYKAISDKILSEDEF